LTILDSYAVLALLKGEPAAADVQHLIQGGTASLTPTGIAEVLDHLMRVVAVSEEDAVLDLAQLGLAGAPFIDSDVSVLAGLLRGRHYHRERRAVSLADCFAAAMASTSGRPLATADPHLLDLCAEESIPTIPLPDSKGRLWSVGSP
jgi:PIN domain nuclease of toxin-antitoxin system